MKEDFEPDGPADACFVRPEVIFEECQTDDAAAIQAATCDLQDVKP